MIQNYTAPESLAEAAQIAAQTGATYLAGGTDLHPRWLKSAQPTPTSLVDVKRIAELKGIRQSDGQVWIGSATLMSDIERDPIVGAAAPLLAEAAGRVACPQIRNRATLGGNLCNASPAADTAGPLIVLDAVLELALLNKGNVTVREVPITDFFVGPGATALMPGEILTRVRFDALGEGRYSAWDKFGTRPAMEIAVASVCVVIGVQDDVVAHARVAYGSVAPVPLRGRCAEAKLLGQRLTDATIEQCVAAAGEEISPITDVRASACYRREMVGVMLRRMLHGARSG